MDIGRDSVGSFGAGDFPTDIPVGSRGVRMDLVSDSEVGIMRGMGSLVFWALLSLSAVVINSYGQQVPTMTATPNVSVAPPGVVMPTVQRTMPSFPAAAEPGFQQPKPAAPPAVVYPKGYIPPPSPPPQVAARPSPAPINPPVKVVVPSPGVPFPPPH